MNNADPQTSSKQLEPAKQNNTAKLHQALALHNQGQSAQVQALY